MNIFIKIYQSSSFFLEIAETGHMALVTACDVQVTHGDLGHGNPFHSVLWVLVSSLKYLQYQFCKLPNNFVFYLIKASLS